MHKFLNMTDLCKYLLQRAQAKRYEAGPRAGSETAKQLMAEVFALESVVGILADCEIDGNRYRLDISQIRDEIQTDIGKALRLVE